MSSPCSLVIDRNNQAVAALKEGRHWDALHVIRAATMQLNDLYQQRDEEMGNDNEEDEEGKPIIRQSLPLRSYPVSFGEHDTRRIQDCFSAMFQQAIVLSRREDNLPVIASVILFNLAVTEHVLGSLGTSRKLVAALKFYKMSYQIIEENKSQCAFGDLLVLALVNNIAEASGQLHDVKKSRRWFKFLGRILGVSAPNCRDLPSLDDNVYVFFYTNALLHDGNMLNVAAAA